MAYYDGGKKGELDFCKLMEQYGGAYLVHDTINQYKDIDVVLNKDSRTVSVKDQSQGDKYKCFLFEYVQERTSDGAKIKGNIHNCQADLYAICSPTKWFIFDAKKLHTFIMNNKEEWKFRRTTAWAEQNNRKVKGANCYDRTYNYVISYDDLRNCDAFLWEGKRI